MAQEQQRGDRKPRRGAVLTQMTVTASMRLEAPEVRGREGGPSPFCGFP